MLIYKVLQPRLIGRALTPLDGGISPRVGTRGQWRFRPLTYRVGVPTHAPVDGAGCFAFSGLEFARHFADAGDIIFEATGEGEPAVSPRVHPGTHLPPGTIRVQMLTLTRQVWGWALHKPAQFLS